MSTLRTSTILEKIKAIDAEADSIISTGTISVHVPLAFNCVYITVIFSTFKQYQLVFFYCLLPVPISIYMIDTCDKLDCNLLYTVWHGITNNTCAVLCQTNGLSITTTLIYW